MDRSPAPSRSSSGCHRGPGSSRSPAGREGRHHPAQAAIVREGDQQPAGAAGRKAILLPGADQRIATAETASVADPGLDLGVHEERSRLRCTVAAARVDRGSCRESRGRLEQFRRQAPQAPGPGRSLCVASTYLPICSSGSGYLPWCSRSPKRWRRGTRLSRRRRAPRRPCDASRPATRGPCGAAPRRRRRRPGRPPGAVAARSSSRSACSGSAPAVTSSQGAGRSARRAPRARPR